MEQLYPPRRRLVASLCGGVAAIFLPLPHSWPRQNVGTCRIVSWRASGRVGKYATRARNVTSGSHLRSTPAQSGYRLPAFLPRRLASFRRRSQGHIPRRLRHDRRIASDSSFLASPFSLITSSCLLGPPQSSTQRVTAHRHRRARTMSPRLRRCKAGFRPPRAGSRPPSVTVELLSSATRYS